MRRALWCALAAWLLGPFGAIDVDAQEGIPSPSGPAEADAAEPPPPVVAPVPQEPPTAETEIDEELPPVWERRLDLPGVAPGAAPNFRSSTLRPSPLLDEIDRPQRVLQVGDFAILPQAQISAAFDDNVNANKDDREDEISSQLSGTVRAQSLFARHSLGFEASATAEPVGRDDEESIFDWIASADGRLDFSRRSALHGVVSFTRGTENIESVEAGEDVTVTEAGGRLAYSQQLRRLGWAIGTGVARTDAEGEDVVDELEAEDPDERDKTSYSVFADADYPLSRRLGAFIGSEYTLDDFDDDEAGRDSHSVEASTGLRLRLRPGIAIRAGVGYDRIAFDDPERDTEYAITAEVGIDGALPLDERTDLRLGVDRSLEPVTVEDAAAATETTLLARLTRRFSRVAAGSIGVTFTRAEFAGDDRTDHDVVARIGYSRALTSRVSLNLGYRFSQRFSDVEEEEFYRNIVTVGLSTRF